MHWIPCGFAVKLAKLLDLIAIRRPICATARSIGGYTSVFEKKDW